MGVSYIELDKLPSQEILASVEDRCNQVMRMLTMMMVVMVMGLMVMMMMVLVLMMRMMMVHVIHFQR